MLDTEWIPIYLQVSWASKEPELPAVLGGGSHAAQQPGDTCSHFLLHIQPLLLWYNNKIPLAEDIVSNSSRCPALYLLLLPGLSYKESVFSPPGMHGVYSEILVLLEMGMHGFCFQISAKVNVGLAVPGWSIRGTLCQERKRCYRQRGARGGWKMTLRGKDFLVSQSATEHMIDLICDYYKLTINWNPDSFLFRGAEMEY